MVIQNQFLDQMSAEKFGTAGKQSKQVSTSFNGYAKPVFRSNVGRKVRDSGESEYTEIQKAFGVPFSKIMGSN